MIWLSDAVGCGRTPLNGYGRWNRFAALEQRQDNRTLPASDRFALAGVAYYLLTKRFPPLPEDRIENEELIPLVELNPEVSQLFGDIITKELAIDLAGRYDTDATLLADLQPLLIERSLRVTAEKYPDAQKLVFYTRFPIVIDGYMPLDDWMRKKPAIDWICRVINEVANALDGLHLVGRQLYGEESPDIAHGRVSPQTILVQPTGSVKVLVDTFRGAATPDPNYLAPEQLRGRTVEQSDVFALAALAYDLTTGQGPRPQGANHDRKVDQIAEQLKRDRRLRRLPLETAQVIARGMHLDLDRRYSDCFAFAHSFERAVVNDRLS